MTRTQTPGDSASAVLRGPLLRRTVNAIPADAASRRLHLTLWRAEIRPDRTGGGKKKNPDMNQKEQQSLVNDLELFIIPAGQIYQMEVLAEGHVVCEIASPGDATPVKSPSSPPSHLRAAGVVGVGGGRGGRRASGAGRGRGGQIQEEMTSWCPLSAC